MIRMTEGLKMTDNLYELRKFVLQDLMKMGYKYIARDREGKIYAYADKPTKQKKEEEWISARSDRYKDISLVSRIFTDIEWENVEPFKIPYTNWKEVPVDTPVVYTGESGKNYVRYFCKYNDENDKVVLYMDGRASLTEQGIFEIYPERVSIYEKEKN